MAWFCGIDPSMSNTAVAIVDPFLHYKVQCFPTKSCGRGVAERMDRFNGIASSVFRFLRDAEPRVICIEGYSHGSTDVATLGEFGGILRSRLTLLDHVTIFDVAPATLKKFVTGKGAGKKAGVIGALAREFGVAFHTDDEYDAFGLALMARLIGTTTDPGNLPRRQAIATVTKEETWKYGTELQNSPRGPRRRSGK